MRHEQSQQETPDRSVKHVQDMYRLVQIRFSSQQLTVVKVTKSRVVEAELEDPVKQYRTVNSLRLPL